MNRFVMIGLTLALVCGSVKAQDKIEIKPSGRILMDAGVFSTDNEDLVNGMAIPDMRVGVKASYGAYKAKIDIGYAYGKVRMKDIFVERQLGNIIWYV